jgi:hypothetical protein
MQVTLNITGDGPRHAPLTGEPLAEAKAHLAAWVAAETVKAATAKAKNDLEAYIISTREKLETNEALQQVGSVTDVLGVINSKVFVSSTEAKIHLLACKCLSPYSGACCAPVSLLVWRLTSSAHARSWRRMKCCSR